MNNIDSSLAIAILDDYQNVALASADWSAVTAIASITLFNDHLADADALAQRLQPFDIICIMRERTALSRTIIECLPRLKLIASTGCVNSSIDVRAAAERGIEVLHTGYDSNATVELTWALILASARNLVEEHLSVRAGGWQREVGVELRRFIWC